MGKYIRKGIKVSELLKEMGIDIKIRIRNIFLVIHIKAMDIEE